MRSSICFIACLLFSVALCDYDEDECKPCSSRKQWDNLVSNGEDPVILYNVSVCQKVLIHNFWYFMYNSSCLEYDSDVNIYYQNTLLQLNNTDIPLKFICEVRPGEIFDKEEYILPDDLFLFKAPDDFKIIGTWSAVTANLQLVLDFCKQKFQLLGDMMDFYKAFDARVSFRAWCESPHLVNHKSCSQLFPDEESKVAFGKVAHTKIEEVLGQGLEKMDKALLQLQCERPKELKC